MEIKGIVMKCLKQRSGIYFQFISWMDVQNLLKLFSMHKACYCLFLLWLGRIQQYYKCVTFSRPQSVEQLLIGKKISFENYKTEQWNKLSLKKWLKSPSQYTKGVQRLVKSDKISLVWGVFHFASGLTFLKSRKKQCCQVKQVWKQAACSWKPEIVHNCR